MWIYRHIAKAKFKGLPSCYPVEGKGEAVPIHAMKVYRENGGKAQFILTPDNRGVVSLMFQMLYTWGKSH